MVKKDKKRPPSVSEKRMEPFSIKKIPTYISGLDEILEGGLPSGKTTVVVGGSGSGKTVMGLEFIYRGAIHGEGGIFLGFEEMVSTLRENASTLGWDLKELEEKGKIFLIEGRIDPDSVITGDFSLKPILAIISAKAKENGVKRVVIDAIEVLLRLLEDPKKIRAELHILNNWLKESNMTTIMTLKQKEEGAGFILQDFFYSMSDCVINLDQRVMNQITTRRLRVIKYRGSGFGRNEYPFSISRMGIRVIPISRLRLEYKGFNERISSGIPQLDSLLGGGYYRGSCILIAGEPGTGKTLLASSYVRDKCKMGERVLYLSLEESEHALVRNVRSAGIDLDPFVKNGLLRVLSKMPEETGAEEHLIQIMDEVDSFCPDHVVVDAISACERMGGKQASIEYQMRLTSLLKERGITVFLTNQTSGSTDKLEISGNGISSLLDTVILISYVRGEGEINRVIQVMKSRGSAHSNQCREFVIRDDGLHIKDVYVGQAGVLTGTARIIQEEKDLLEERKMDAEIDAKVREISLFKKEMEMEIARMKVELDARKRELELLRLIKERAHGIKNEIRKLRAGGKR